MATGMYANANNTAQAASRAIGTTGLAERTGQFFSPGAVADRATARLQKERADQELLKAQATRPTQQDLTAMGELQSQQLEMAVQEARQANARLAGQSVYSALDRFNADGTVGHLNQSLRDLRNNPVGKTLPGFSEIASFQQFGPADAALLEPYGITPEDLQQNPELNKFIVKAIKTDGTEVVMPMDALYASTGYGQYATLRELEQQKIRADIFNKTQLRNAVRATADERTAHTMTSTMRTDDPDWQPGNPEYDLAYIENLEKVKSQGKSNNLTQDEAEAERETQLNRPGDVPAEEWRPGNPDYDQAYQDNFQAIIDRDRETSAQRERGGVRTAKQRIQNRAEINGEDFFGIDFTKDRSKRLQYEDDVQDIARLGRLDFSEADKKTITHIHELIGLGNKAGTELGEEETGLLDRFTRGVGAYVSDSTSGRGATAAYAAYRNTLRNALFGSALTEHEIKAFNEQMGNLGQQEGPVLESFRQGLTQVRDKLQSLMNLGDSYVTHFYLGSDNAELGDIIDAMDERLNMIDRYRNPGQTASGAPVSQEEVYVRPRTIVPPAGQPFAGSDGAASLYSEIFGDQ